MRKKRILFVDDEPNVIDGLRRMFRKQRDEWDMEFVSSGAEALQRLVESPYDVVVSDMQMPGMDGAELLERVLNEYPDVARIVLSGYADEATTTRALKVAHQYLSKPTDPEKLKLAIARSCPMEKIVRNERIRTAVATCDKLPSMPTLCVEITRAVESETSDARSIAKIISRDMAMSAKLLQLVNSSFFGVGRRVSSIEQTVALLGAIRLKALVMSEHIFKAFAPPRELNHFSMTGLWNHSLAVAEIARAITRAEGQGDDRPDQAFTAGLLHDIGLLVLACKHADEFEIVLQRSFDEQRFIGEVEMDVLDVTHGEIGAYLLGLWGLPMRLIEAVALHHTPNEIAYDGLCALSAVHVADALVAEFQRAHSLEVVDFFAPPLDMGYLERLGLADHLDRWRTLADKHYQQAMELQT